MTEQPRPINGGDNPTYVNENGDLIIDTGKLTGIMLDYWALRAMGMPHEVAELSLKEGISPSFNWKDGAPMFDVHKIAISPLPPAMAAWVALWQRPPESSKILLATPLPGSGPARIMANGDTALIAAARVMVALAAGPRVSVPPSIQKLAESVTTADTVGVGGSPGVQ